jgi:transcriptional regulator with XRE-family HTH domain
MAEPLRVTFARWCRDARADLDITQSELAAAVGVSRAHIASIETGRANPSLGIVERISDALGLELMLTARPPTVVRSAPQHDIAHARCSAYADRRLRRAGWEVRREVTVGRGRIRGWIDLLAFDPRRRILLVIEIKTWIGDIGAIERQVDWYEREGPLAARGFGWRPSAVASWLLVLATSDVDDALRRNRALIDSAFPTRAPAMRDLLAGRPASTRRAIALMDPRSRKREWVVATSLDRRRTPAPYGDYAEAARVMSA